MISEQGKLATPALGAVGRPVPARQKLNNDKGNKPCAGF